MALAAMLAAAPAQAEFGVASFAAAASSEDGSTDLVAGSHPFSYGFEIGMNTDAEGQPEGSLAGLAVDLPPGVVGSPAALPRCSREEFDGSEPRCPLATQIGVMRADATGLGSLTLPVFNLIPPPGYAAAFGAGAVGNSVVELVSLVGSGPETHLRVTAPVLPGGVEVRSVSQTLWGVPGDNGHDGERGSCLGVGGSCPLAGAPAPLLTLPTSCGEPLTTTLAVRSVEEPGRIVTASSTSREPGGPPQGMRDCGSLPFAPSFSFSTEGVAGAPIGVRVELGLPSSEAPFGPVAAALQALTVRLPPGLTLNPPTAAGLDACSPEQIGLDSAVGEAARFDAAEPSCPAASKLGGAEVVTPALDHPLSGNVYLATPRRNPFGTLFALYVVLEDPASGTLVKLPGRLDAAPDDGRLTVSFERLPQLALSGMRLEFAGGPRARLVSPPTCGSYLAGAEAVPSSAPERGPVQLGSTFTLDRGAAGACPPSSLPNEPILEAGAAEAVAGLQTPLLLHLRRGDGTQQLSALDLSLPPGLIAKLAGVATCGEAAIPACPASSAVGQAKVGVGVGAAPLYAVGTVYLAGPYDGAPYSLLVSVPAVAGPFDLGTVAVRAAVRVDPLTGQLSVASDRFPRILDGVPLPIRSLSLSLDRPGFVRNPTSCEPMTLDAVATSTLGQSAALSNWFQLGDCGALPFRPKVALRFSGGLRRNAHPAMRLVLRSDGGEAAIAGATLAFPAGELLDLQHLRGLCAQGTAPKHCPDGSRLGQLRLTSPLLDAPATGTLYLQRPSHRLPELIAEVRSGALRFVLHGRTVTRNGHFGVSFPTIPDVPLSKAVLTLRGGRRGLFVNSRSLCSGTGKAGVSLSAHSGKRLALRIRPQVAGC